MREFVSCACRSAATREIAGWGSRDGEACQSRGPRGHLETVIVRMSAQGQAIQTGGLVKDHCVAVKAFGRA